MTYVRPVESYRLKAAHKVKQPPDPASASWPATTANAIARASGCYEDGVCCAARSFEHPDSTSRRELAGEGKWRHPGLRRGEPVGWSISCASTRNSARSSAASETSRTSSTCGPSTIRPTSGCRPSMAFVADRVLALVLLHRDPGEEAQGGRASSSRPPRPSAPSRPFASSISTWGTVETNALRYPRQRARTRPNRLASAWDHGPGCPPASASCKQDWYQTLDQL